MAFTIEPQPGEEIYFFREVRGSHSHVFAMAVSNQAVYLSAQKFAVSDTWYFKRVALADVKEVGLIKQRLVYLVLLSAAMIVFGAVTTSLMAWGLLHRGPVEPIRGSGWPIAILVGGLVIPFIARGRRILVVRMRRGKFKWKPQLAVDKKTRDEYARLQDEIAQACRKAGMKIVDS